MKNKILLLMFMIIAFIPMIKADLCTDSSTLEGNCTFISPLINCTTPTYSIINITNNETLIASTMDTFLTNTSGFYRFNFSMQPGDYLIVLCDGSSREVKVMSPKSVALDSSKCPDTIQGILTIFALIILCLIIVLFAWTTRINIIGIFAGVLMAVASKYLAPCNNFIAISTVIIGLLISLVFIIRSGK